MYAVFETGGKQFRAEPGVRVRIPALAAEEGSTVTFDRVLLTGGGEGEPTVGTPTVEGAAVRAEVASLPPEAGFRLYGACRAASTVPFAAFQSRY